MEITASSLKLRANAPEGQKAISYQHAAAGDEEADETMQRASLLEMGGGDRRADPAHVAVHPRRARDGIGDRREFS